MVKFASALAALRVALALVASVFVLFAHAGPSEASGERSAMHAARAHALSVQRPVILAETEGRVPLLMQLTANRERTVWMRGTSRRSHRAAAAVIVAIATTGCFPDHCASACIQMVSGTGRARRAGTFSHVCAAPTRAPPLIS